MDQLSRINQVLIAVALVLVIALLIGGRQGLEFAALFVVVGAVAYPLMRERK